MNKWIIYGGIGAMALAGGFVVYKRAAASPGNEAQSSASTDLASLYPNTIYGGATGSTTDTSGTDQLSSLLAAQLTQSTQNYELSKETLASGERVSMATLDTQKTIALDTNQANIEQSLASQIGQIVAGMAKNPNVNVGETAGMIGFKDGKITFDVGQTYIANWFKPPVNQAAVDKVKVQPATVPTVSQPSVSLPHV